MNSHAYFEELCRIKASLQLTLQSVSVRGEDLASFIYAEEKGRAVEISKDYDGWWLEFWEESEDEDAPPVKDEVLKDEDQVVTEALRWLCRLHDASQQTLHSGVPDIGRHPAVPSP